MSVLDKFRKIVINRAELARRWYGLTTAGSAAAFVVDHPDVKAQLENPVIAAAALREGGCALIADVLDGKNVEALRATFGDDLIDKIIEADKRLCEE